MTKGEINAAVDDLFRTAKALLQRDGYHIFLAMFFTPRGTIPVSLQEALQESERQYDQRNIAGAYAIKDNLAAIVRNVAQKTNAFGVCIIGETWTLDRPPSYTKIIGGDEPGKAKVLSEIPRFSPDRVEALCIQFEFRLPDGSKCEGVRSARFERQRDSFGRERILFTGKEKRGEGEIMGLFKNLLG